MAVLTHLFYSVGAPAPLGSLQFTQLNSIVSQKLHHNIVMTLAYAMFHKLASVRTVLQLLKHLTRGKAARSGNKTLGILESGCQ